MRKKLSVTAFLPVEGKTPVDLIIIAALSAVSFLCPFAEYTYNRVKYDFLGYYFLTGINVAGKTVYIAPVPMLFIFSVFILLTVVTALVFRRISPRLASVIMLVAGVAQMAIAVLTKTQLTNVMTGLRNVDAGWGLTMLGLCGAALIVRGFYTLFKVGAMTALDFMVLPAGLYLLINNYFPMFGLFIAFKNIDYSVGILNSPWCGFDNFRYLFSTSDAWLITKNTLLYNLSFIIIGNLLGICIGLLLANLISKRMQKFYQTAILLPQIISYVIVGYIVFAFLSNQAGLLTKALERNGNTINFYADRTWWPIILSVVYNWKQIGFSAVLYLAAISSIDYTLYEASAIDGASRLQQIWRITLPMIKSTIITLVLLQIGRIFYSDFGLFYQTPMNVGMLYNVTQTIDTYVYRMLMTNNRVSMASAASFYQSIVGFVLVLTANAVVRRIDRENALF